MPIETHNISIESTENKKHNDRKKYLHKGKEREKGFRRYSDYQIITVLGVLTYSPSLMGGAPP